MLKLRNVVKRYASGAGLFKRRWLTALDGLSLDIQRGEFFSLVGESGCGKSTLARIVAGLENLDEGEFWLGGELISDTTRFRDRELRRRVQMIFQDPYSSLNPRMTVGAILREPLVSFKWGDKAAIARRVAELADIIQFPASALERYPHQFSGGQRQRIAIARALAANPELLICDEPVSALDLSIKGQIINLLIDIQQQLGVTILFISHDLSLVSKISDRVGVMYLGKILEIGKGQEVFTNPRHPYTQLLIMSAPTVAPRERDRERVPMGEVPSPFAIPSGCRFRDRCVHADEKCARIQPELASLPSLASHCVACHHHEAIAMVSRGLPTLDPLRGMELYSTTRENPVMNDNEKESVA